jgi:chromosome segregation ATPase
MSSGQVDRTRALKVLVGVRERRGRSLEEAVEAALAQQAEAREHEQAAQQALQGALAAEAAERNKLLSMTDAGQDFNVDAMTLRQHAAEWMKGKVVVQEQEVERCQTTVEQRTQDLRSRRGELARNREKIEALKGDIAAIRAARQSADDDLQDEESEETAISRMLQARSTPTDEPKRAPGRRATP